MTKDKSKNEAITNAEGADENTINDNGDDFKLQEIESPDSEIISDEKLSLENKINDLNQEIDQKQNDYLRACAEIQNIQKRHQNDIEKINKYGIEKLVKDLLPVMDTLEKSLSHFKEQSTDSIEAITPIQEGIELTLKLLTSTLQKWGLECIEPHGQPFDPNHHEAMSMIESSDVPSGHVLNVFMSGYKLHDRVLRPAMVAVSKEVSNPDKKE